MTLLKDLARAKITFQARTLRTILTEGMDMTDQSKHDQMLALVESLRSVEADERCNDSMCYDAADALTAALDEIATIEREAGGAIAALLEENTTLRTENERLRVALRVYACGCDPAAGQCLAHGRASCGGYAMEALKGSNQ